MSDLQVRNETFEYPDNGTNAGWGEDSSDWATAITDAVNNLSAPNDVPLTSANIANNQVAAANIIGLQFNLTQVKQVEITYYIQRDGSGGTITETGTIQGHFDGTTFSICQEYCGDSGVSISALDSGQLQYTSTDFSGQTSGIIKFKATTITN